MLIAIEGVDGAGKNTLTRGLRAQFEARGKSVTSVAFPRYGRSVEADIAAEALHGQQSRLVVADFRMAGPIAFARERFARIETRFERHAKGGCI